MDYMDTYENLTDEECVSLCMSCIARGVAIPQTVRTRVQKLGIWKLIVGAADEHHWSESTS